MNFLSRRTPYLEHSIYARRRFDMVAGGKARSTEKKERNKKRQPVRQKSGKVAEN